MDRRISWHQPEQLGPATELWTKIINEARDGIRQTHLSENMSAKPNANRNLDYIPLSPDYPPNGNIFDEKSVNTGYSKRKDNIASTYDWNSSGKLRSGGTPWKLDGTEYREGVVGLHEEIQDFYKFMFPRLEEHVMRQEVVSRVQGIIQSIWPDAKVEIYGSCKTRLFLPTSDIDLVVFGDLGDNPCCRLGEELKNSALPSQGTIKVLDKATVPIVKLTDAFTQIRVDISFNVKTTTECAELIENFISQFPTLPQLVFVLKQFLLQRDLNEVWTGGISSYGLILMIVSFLQLHVPPEPINYGVLLIEFFELYGVNFNYFKTGITVENGGSYFPKEDASFMTDRFSLLCLKDPLNNGVDLGRNSFGFMEVRKAFHYAYQVLTQAVVPHIDQESNGHSILGRIIRVTDEVMDHRLWVQQNWARKAMAMYPHKFSIHCNIPQPDAFCLPDTALRIAQPIRPVNATTIILADSSQRNSQETGSCQEVNKKSAMNPTAATNMSNSNDVINNKITSISSSSSGEIVSSSSDSESEMSSQTSGSSKDTIDSVQGPSKSEAVPSVGPETSTDKAWTQEIKKPVSHGQTYHKQSKFGKRCNHTSNSVRGNAGNSLSKQTAKERQVVTPHIEVTVSSNNKSEIQTSLPKGNSRSSPGGTSSSLQPVVSKTYRSKNYTNQHGKFRHNSGGNSTQSGSSGGDNNNNGSQNSNSVNKRLKKKHKKDNSKRGAKN